MADEIGQLYEHGEKLRLAEDPQKEKDSYLAIIQATKGSDKAKQLAAQFLASHFAHFPDESVTAMTAVLDLCEDLDVGTRVQAIRALPMICKHAPENVGKMADVLGQMLQTDDHLELEHLRNACVALLRIDPKAVIHGLFTQIHGGDASMRLKALSLLKDRVMDLHRELFANNEEAEAELVDNIKKAIATGVTGVEFKCFYKILQRLTMFKKRDSGPQFLEVILPHAGLDKDYDPSDEERYNRFILLMTLASSLYHKGAHPAAFVNYISTQILPRFDQMPEGQMMPLLKLFAEGSDFATGPIARVGLEPVFKLLKSLMPLPPDGGLDMPKIQFACVECLLYAFHQLAAKSPGSLNELCGIKILTGQPSDLRVYPDSAEKCADLKKRLKYLDNRVDLYSQQCTQAVAKLRQLPKSDETNQKIKDIVLAQRVNQNLRQLAQMLLKDKPTFAANRMVTLSWKPIGAGQVRKAPEAQNAPQKKPKVDPQANKRKQNSNNNNNNNNNQPNKRGNQQQQGQQRQGQGQARRRRR